MANLIIMEEVQQEDGSREIKLDLKSELSRGKDLLMRNKRSMLIRRVVKFVRSVDPNKYTPHYVSVGPYHYHDEVKDNDDIRQKKLKCASYASVFCKETDEGVDDESTKNMLAKCERDLKSWDVDKFYDLANTNFSSPEEKAEFLRMMLFDACYILEWFAGKQKVERDPSELRMVEHDVLYLLENQIPFTFLEEINTLTSWNSRRLVHVFGDYIIERVVKMYKYAHVKGVKQQENLSEPSEPPSHLLHLLYMYFTGKVLVPVENSSNTSTSIRPQHDTGGNDEGSGNQIDDSRSHVDGVWRWRRATEYHKANVKFKPRMLIDAEEGHGCSVIDVELKGNTLMMPLLKIDYHTWSILRNLMALEQQNPEVLRHSQQGKKNLGRRVTAYCMFLKEIACTAEDVAFLSKSGVIQHIMTDDATCAQCFAKLCNGVVFNKHDLRQNYLLKTYQQLGKHVDSRWSNWLATLRHKYLHNPWVITGLVVATILLVCAVVQALYAVKGATSGDSRDSLHR